MKHKKLRKILSTSLAFAMVLSQGLATAQADEIQIYSNEQKEENSNLLILDNDGDSAATENITLQFGTGLHQLYWDIDQSEFVFTDDVNVTGDLGVTGDIDLTGSVNMQAGETVDGVDVSELDTEVGDQDYTNGNYYMLQDVDEANSLADNMETINTEVGNRDYTSNNFVSDGETVTASIDALDQALGGGDTNITGTKSNLFVIDTDDLPAGADVTLAFGNTINEQLYWDTSAGNFVITDDLTIQGGISATGNIDTTGDISGNTISSDSTMSVGTDLDVTDNVTIGGDAQVDQNFRVVGHSRVDGNFDANGNVDIAGTLNVDSNTTMGGALDVDGTITAGTGDVAITNAAGNLDGEVIIDDSIDQDSIDWGTGAGQISGADLPLVDNFDNSNNTDVQLVTEDIDAAIGDRTAYTEENIITSGESLATSVDNIDVAIGARDYTDGNVVTDGDTVTGSVEDLSVAIGDRDYTDGLSLTDGDTITGSLEDLNQAIDTLSGGTNDQTMFVSMNDLTVQEDGTNNRANLYTDSETGANPHQYYILKTRRTAQQDLTLRFKVKLPEDFKDWSVASGNNLSFFYKNDTAPGTTSDTQLDITVQDEAGTTIATSTGLYNTAWTELAQDFAGGASSAGDYVYITVKGYGRYNAGTYYSPYIGEIVLRYNSTALQSS